MGCYQTVQRGIPGYCHQYELESCTWTPSKEPQRTKALARREKGRQDREAAARGADGKQGRQEAEQVGEEAKTDE